MTGKWFNTSCGVQFVPQYEIDAIDREAHDSKITNPVEYMKFFTFWQRENNRDYKTYYGMNVLWN